MFFISSQNTENPEDVRFPMVTRKSSSEHAHTIFSRYRLEAPFQLTFITFRPEDVENHFAISMLAPDYMTMESSFEYPVSVNGKLRFKKEYALTLSPADIQADIVRTDEAQKWLEGKAPKKIIVVPGKIINIVI